VVSDSHLAPQAAAFNDNWQAVRACVKRAQADLTVHLGDITVDGVKDPSQFRHVQTITADWPSPIRYLPGNHDIGDNPPGPGLAPEEPVRMASLDAYRAAFGRDYWSLAADGWHLIGLNAQLMGTGTREEERQWEWLASDLAAAVGMSAVIFIHKPLFQGSLADDRPHHRYVPLAPRHRLLELLAAVHLRPVVSGHTHQYCDRLVAGVRHLWLPSTAFFLPDELQERMGEKIIGLALIDLSPEHVGVDVICPEGVGQHNALDHPVYPKIAAPARSSRP